MLAVSMIWPADKGLVYNMGRNQPNQPLQPKNSKIVFFGEKRCMTSTEPADAKNNDISSRNLDHTAAYTKLTQRWKMHSIEM